MTSMMGVSDTLEPLDTGEPVESADGEQLKPWEMPPVMGEFGLRTKRQFCALTSITGLEPFGMSKCLGYPVKATSRWGRDKYVQPPEVAWELVESTMRAHLRIVSQTVSDIEEAYSPETSRILITWYRSEGEYERARVAAGLDAKHAEIMWSIADARSRAICTELMMDGYQVEFLHPGEMPGGHEDGIMAVPRD